MLHSYYAICGLSLAGQSRGLRKLHPGLGITMRASIAAGIVDAAEDAEDADDHDACVACEPDP